VAQYLGDGVLAYFGYSQAHEDDAERAVRAGLELTRAVSVLKTRVSLQTRIGIATGLVVVGDLMDSGNAPERGIVGETPKLAARLQGLAEPNMVVIAVSRRKLLGNLFDLEDLGAKQLTVRASPDRCRRGQPAGKFGGEPLRGAARNRRHRARGEGKKKANYFCGVGQGQRAAKARWCCSRAKLDRQIAAYGRTFAMPHQRAAHALALFLLATAYRQRVLSNHQPHGTRRRLDARRHNAGET
jgi:hypothetical protein